MQKKVICHIGMVKTGSTFIQQTILGSLEEPLLSPLGIYLWTSKKPRFPFIVPEIYQTVIDRYDQEGRNSIDQLMLRHHDTHSDAVNLFALTEYLALFSNDAVCSQLNQRLSTALANETIRKVICSHEDIASAGIRHSNKPADHLITRQRALTGLKTLFSGMDVTIVLVIRRQDHLMKSLYNAMVVSHMLNVPFSEMQAWFGNLFYYDALMDLLVNLFGQDRIQLLFFEELKENQLHFTEKFLKIISPNIRITPYSQLIPGNVSYTPSALRIMYYANEVLRKTHRASDEIIPRRVSTQLEQERTALAKALTVFRPNANDTYDYGLNDADEHRLLADYIPSNSRLFNHHIPADSPDQKWRSYYLGEK
jgi:hypothetical protein